MADCDPEFKAPKIPQERERISDGCNPADTGIPEEFNPPSGKIEPTYIQRNIPRSLQILSPEITVTCATSDGVGPTGSDVTLALGSVTRSVSWLDVTPPIDSTRLDFINKIPLDNLQILTDPSNPPSIVEITNLARISTEQAGSLLGMLTDTYTEVVELSQAQASSLQDCYWRVTEGAALCPNIADRPAVLNSDNPPPPVDGVNWTKSEVLNPASITGVWTSATSEQDAIDKANISASSNLSCLYLNVPVTVTCSEIVGDPGTDVYAESGITSYTVGARVFAASNTTEADALALAYAVEKLNCYFESEEVDVSCNDIAGPNYAISVDLIQETSNEDFIEQSNGKFRVEAGYVVSTEGQGIATTLAQALGWDSLKCYFKSKAVSAECEETLVTVSGSFTQTGDYVNLFSEGRSNSPQTLELGAIESTTSQDDADIEAQSLVTNSLNCIYCNRALDSLCDEFSISAVEGVPVDYICASDPQVALDLATAAGSLAAGPGTAETSCFYGNDEASYQCPAEATTDISFPLTPQTVGANQFVAILKATANGLRDTYLISISQCNVGNISTSAYCEGYDANGLLTDARPVTGSSSPGGKVDVNPNVYTKRVGVTITTNSGSVYSGGDIASAQTEVNDNAEAFAKGTLNCLYENIEQIYDCPTGIAYDLEAPGTIGSGAVTAESPGQADSIALALAQGQSVCIPKDSFGVGHPGASAKLCGDAPFEICAFIEGSPCDVEDTYPTVSVSVNEGTITYKDVTLSKGAATAESYSFNDTGNQVLHVFATYQYSDNKRTALVEDSGDGVVLTSFSEIKNGAIRLEGDLDSSNNSGIYIGSVSVSKEIYNEGKADETWCWSVSTSQVITYDYTIFEGGGAGPEAFRIYWADGLFTDVDFSTAIANRDSDSPEDEWGIFFEISTLHYTITYGEGLDIYDDTGTDQTQWYLLIYGDGKLLTTGGVYRSETFCAGGEPVKGLVKIG